MVWQWQRNRGHRRRDSATGVAPPSAETVSAQTVSAQTVSGWDASEHDAPAPVTGHGPLSDPMFVAGLRTIPSGPAGGQTAWPATDIIGVSPAGARVEARIGEFEDLVLFAFLTTRCDGCDEFWQGLRDGEGTELPAWVETVVVTKAAGSTGSVGVEQVAAGITRLPVIMSDGAWADYRVSGYPFFVLVDAPTRTVIGETVGFGWADVLSMVRAARA